MIPKQAIEKAIEGGWELETIVGIEQERNIELSGEHPFWHTTALDPTFWISLGKALGPFADGDGLLHLESPGGVAIDRDVNWADYTAHRFYDLILTGGDLDAYWKELLSNKEI